METVTVPAVVVTLKDPDNRELKVDGRLFEPHLGLQVTVEDPDNRELKVERVGDVLQDLKLLQSRIPTIGS